ncbi:hypothetical protein CLIB1423_09S04434 [[Candida] railenensis]|uniref:C3HC-type domain-containing protein n=1 Tax=[Candida] railenensis TaxID=45579 RepID=A0A9P0QQP1_9ASCO|nr:hypothetical protein CLIB1423_09S04434 [[Candida] railenensis]
MNDTSQVLSDCLALLSSPAHEKYPSSSGRGSSHFNSHPDIQYFKEIKDKNHYEYHKSKYNSSNINHSKSLRGNDVQVSIQNVLSPQKSVLPAQSTGSSVPHTDPRINFNPHDRSSLISRLSTFSVLNWQVPDLGLTAVDLNELTCARKGWKCLKGTSPKNTLSCTYCHSVMQLKFNDASTGANTSYFPFDFDADDYMELNVALAQNYLKQIRYQGHDDNCLWRVYETPLDGVYYPRPYIDETSIELVEDYLKNLKALTDNNHLIVDLRPIFKNSVNFQPPSPSEEFISKSNSLLVEKYYKEDQENSYYDIQLNSNIPGWMYRIAALGWSLHVQYFSRQYVILLVCSQCNSRVFLPQNQNQNQSQTQGELNLSPSRILTPCKYPPFISNVANNESIFDDVEEEELSKIDIVNEHKPWCCHLKQYPHNRTLEDLLFELILVETETNTTKSTKRKSSSEIAENLNRLNKLRKVFLNQN